MIEINLLPEELRRQKRFDFKFDLEMLGNIKFLAGGIFAGVLVILLLFLFIGSSVRKNQIIRLMAKEQAISPQKAQAEEANKEILSLIARMGELSEITKGKFPWSRKLNDLSDVALPGMWFTRVYTDSGGRFIIEGSVISKREEAMATVGKFMKDARENQSFFRDFTDIKLESVQRKGTGDKDVVDFRIALYF